MDFYSGLVYALGGIAKKQENQQLPPSSAKKPNSFMQPVTGEHLSANPYSIP